MVGIESSYGWYKKNPTCLFEDKERQCSDQTIFNFLIIDLNNIDEDHISIL